MTNDAKNAKAEELAKLIKSKGPNHGVYVRGETVILMGPGAPYSISPLLQFSQADIDEAVRLNLMKKTTWTLSSTSGSWPFDMFEAV
jgi:hypothetical protein